MFTASYGLADFIYAAEPLDVIAATDTALPEAEADGKDRLSIPDHSSTRPARTVLG